MNNLKPIEVEISLDNLHCFIEGDGVGSEKPYLWTVFFKIDGDTCKVDSALKLEGRAVVMTTPGDHGDLVRDDVDVGDDVPIPPSLGLIRTTLKPIYLETPIAGVDRVPGMVGCVVVLLEEDATPGDAIARGHEALNQAVQRELDNLIPTLGFAHQEVKDEDIEAISKLVGDSVTAAIEANVSVWDWLGGLGDMDDKVGSTVFRVSLDQLNARLDRADTWNPVLGLEHTFGDDNQNAEGRWLLTGRITPSRVPDGDLFPPENPSPWHSLGGRTGGTPALALLDGALQVFARGAGERSVFSVPVQAWKADSRGRWSLFGQTPIASPPVAITAPAGNQVYVFARGGDNTLLFNSIKSWGFSIPDPDWVSLSGTMVGTPAVSYALDQLNIFVLWNDNTVWYIRKHDSGWSDWSQLGHLGGDLPGQTVADSPVAVTAEDNVPRVFARSGSNELLYFDLNGWRSLGGQIKGIPAAVSWGGSRIDVFACGMDNAVWHICSDDSVVWSAWESLGNSIAAPNTDPRRLQKEFSPAISVVSTDPNTLRIVVRGAHGGVFQKSWMRDHWSPAVGEWEQLGDIVALAGPVAITKPLGIGGYGTTIAIRDKNGAVQLFS